MLNTSLILAAAEGHHVVNELPMDPIWYGLLVFALLMAALAALARQEVTDVVARAEHGGVTLEHDHAHGLVGGGAVRRTELWRGVGAVCSRR